MESHQEQLTTRAVKRKPSDTGLDGDLIASSRRDQSLPPTPKSSKLSNKRRDRRREQDGDFVCELCGARYSKYSSLRTHRSTHGPKRYECPTCGKPFHRRELLTEHHYVHLPAQFPCPTCGKLFKTPKNLEVHLRIHSGVKRHRCDYAGCDQAFVQKTNLIAHRSTHLPLEEKIYHCPYCPKNLTSMEAADVHVRSHGEKPHKCELCSREFLRRAMLRRHLIGVHGTHRYACQFCPVVLKQITTFTRHLEKRHPDVKDTWEESGYVDSRLMPFDHSSATARTAISRRNPTVMLVGQDLMEVTGVKAEGLEEVVEETIVGMDPDNEVEVEYHTEENILLPGNHGSELLLLRLNQNGELVLSLQGGEEVEVVQKVEFPESQLELMEEEK